MPHGKPIITGTIMIDVAPFVSESRGMGEDGYKYAWNVIAGAPPGVPIRFNIGKLRYLAQDLAVQFLSEARKATSIDIAGEDARGIQALITFFRAGWDTGDTFYPKSRLPKKNAA